MKLKNIIDFIKTYPYVPLFISLLIIFNITSDGKVFSLSNIHAVLQRSTYLGLIAIGQTLAFLTKNFDLSVGGIYTLSMSVGVLAITSGFGLESVIFFVLLTGLVMGFINGILISHTKVPSFIVTLATMFFTVSLARTLTLRTVSTAPLMKPLVDFLRHLPYCDILFPIIVWFAVSAFFIFLLKYTRFGKNIYAVGGDIESAWASGTPVKRTLLLVFMISGVCAAISMILFIYVLGYTSSVPGNKYLLASIGAVVIGGTKITGGVGGLGGTLVGVLVFGFTFNYLNLMRVSAFYQDFFAAVAILVFVLLYRYIR